jgi:hypothetical protein
MVRFRPQVEALDEGAIDSSINEPHRPMTQHTTSTGAESTADAEGHLVAELCRRVARRRGDVATLVDDEVRRLAPLSTPADQRRLDVAV